MLPVVPRAVTDPEKVDLDPDTQPPAYQPWVPEYTAPPQRP